MRYINKCSHNSSVMHEISWGGDVEKFSACPKRPFKKVLLFG